MVFVTKIENGNKISDGLCIRCAKEMGVPVDNMLGNVMNQFGISADELETMEDGLNNMFDSTALTPSDNDDIEEGGAPAIDMPKLFENAGFQMNAPQQPKSNKKGAEASEKPKKYKFLDTYCRNLTKRAADGKLDRIVGRDKELDRIIQILCRRQKTTLVLSVNRVLVKRQSLKRWLKRLPTEKCRISLRESRYISWI